MNEPSFLWLQIGEKRGWGNSFKAALPKWSNAGIIISRALDSPAANSNISLKMSTSLPWNFSLVYRQEYFPCVLASGKILNIIRVEKYTAQHGEKKRGKCEHYYFTEFPAPPVVSVVLITIMLPGSISSYFTEMTYSCFSFLAPKAWPWEGDDLAAERSVGAGGKQRLWTWI